MKNTILTIGLFQIAISSIAQHNFAMYGAAFYQSKHLAYSEQALFESIESSLLRDFNVGYSLKVNYTYFLTKNHGIGLSTHYGINDYLFNEGIALKSADGKYIIEATGYVFRMVGGSFNYLFRFNSKKHSKLTYGFSAGIGKFIQQQHRLKLNSNQTFGINTQTSFDTEYLFFSLEPQVIIKLYENRNHHGVDVTLGLLNRVLVLEQSDYNPKLQSGISMGATFVF